MSENKYSVTITVKSGDRVLTELVYPNQSYGECVGTQAAISRGLIGAGIYQAELKGEPMPDGLKASVGMGNG